MVTVEDQYFVVRRVVVGTVAVVKYDLEVFLESGDRRRNGE